MILVCAHAGLKTGEDGPTHADPQALQLLQGNFPRGVAITLTPWEPQEIWPLLAAALARRPALIAPFVTRPSETVLDRAGPGPGARRGRRRAASTCCGPARDGDGTVVLQESAVAYAFVAGGPAAARHGTGVDPWVYYVASAELFDLLPPEEQQRHLPGRARQRGHGHHGLHAAHDVALGALRPGPRGHAPSVRARGHFLGSGQGEVVLAEAGLDGAGQYAAIRSYLDARARARPSLQAR